MASAQRRARARAMARLADLESDAAWSGLVADMRASRALQRETHERGSLSARKAERSTKGGGVALRQEYPDSAREAEGLDAAPASPTAVVTALPALAGVTPSTALGTPTTPSKLPPPPPAAVVCLRAHPSGRVLCAAWDGAQWALQAPGNGARGGAGSRSCELDPAAHLVVLRCKSGTVALRSGLAHGRLLVATPTGELAFRGASAADPEAQWAPVDAGDADTASEGGEDEWSGSESSTDGESDDGNQLTPRTARRSLSASLAAERGGTQRERPQLTTLVNSAHPLVLLTAELIEIAVPQGECLETRLTPEARELATVLGERELRSRAASAERRRDAAGALVAEAEQRERAASFAAEAGEWRRGARARARPFLRFLRGTLDAVAAAQAQAVPDASSPRLRGVRVPTAHACRSPAIENSLRESDARAEAEARAAALSKALAAAREECRSARARAEQEATARDAAEGRARKVLWELERAKEALQLHVEELNTELHATRQELREKRPRDSPARARGRAGDRAGRASGLSALWVQPAAAYCALYRACLRATDSKAAALAATALASATAGATAGWAARMRGRRRRGGAASGVALGAAVGAAAAVVAVAKDIADGPVGDG